MISKQYLAGIIDGEGWVGVIFGNLHYFTPRIQIELGIKRIENLDLLKEIVKTFGGKIINHKRLRYHIYFRKYEVLTLIDDLMPYIRLKKKHFKIIKQLMLIKNNEKNKDKLNQLIRELRNQNDGSRARQIKRIV